MQIAIGTSIASAVLQGASRLYPDTLSVSIKSGSGYAGSVYSSDWADQWYADGVPIEGEASATYTMTRTVEGKAISCGNSNRIRMWMPTDLISGKAAWLDPKREQITSGGKVVRWPDQFGGNDFTQYGGGSTPAAETIDGYPAALWPDNGTLIFLRSETAFNASWFAIVMQYMSGGVSNFKDYDTFIGTGEPNDGAAKIMGEINKNYLFAYENRGFASVNGAPLYRQVLPLPKSLVVLPSIPLARNWTLGMAGFQGAENGRIWRGPMFEALMLSQEPTGDTLDRITACMMHRNGLSEKIPAANPYKTQGPQI